MVHSVQLTGSSYQKHSRSHCHCWHCEARSAYHKKVVLLTLVVERQTEIVPSEACCTHKHIKCILYRERFHTDSRVHCVGTQSLCRTFSRQRLYTVKLAHDLTLAGFTVQYTCSVSAFNH